MQLDLVHPAADVHSERFDARFELLEPDLLYLKKRIFRLQPESQIDVFANRWQIYVGNLPAGQVRLLNHGKYKSYAGPLAVFVPPFGLVDWKIAPGFCDFEVYHSTVELPRFVPRSPFLIRLKKLSELGSYDRLFDLLSQTQRREPIVSERTRSPLARKIRRFILETYREDLDIKNIAGDLGLLHSVVSRSFKECYGLGPLDYRNRLRVDAALNGIQMKGHSVTEAAFEAGFEGLSRFYVQFRRIHEVRPLKMKLKFS